MSSKLLTTQEAMDRLGMSRATVQARIREGRFHPIRRGKDNYFHPTEIEAEIARIAEVNKTRLITGRPVNRAATMPADPKASKGGRSVQTVHISNSPDYSGDIAARACELFDDGKSQREVLRELKITFELVEHLYAKWKALGTEWHVPTKQLTSLRERFAWGENPPTAQGLVAAVDRTVRTEVERLVREYAKSATPAPIEPNAAPASPPAKLPGEELTPAERAALEELEQHQDPDTEE